MNNAYERYTYRINWSFEDQEYIGSCVELPSLSWLSTTQEGALKGIKGLAKDVVLDLLSSGDNVPEPDLKFNLNRG